MSGHTQWEFRALVFGQFFFFYTRLVAPFQECRERSRCFVWSVFPHRESNDDAVQRAVCTGDEPWPKKIKCTQIAEGLPRSTLSLSKTVSWLARTQMPGHSGWYSIYTTTPSPVVQHTRWCGQAWNFMKIFITFRPKGIQMLTRWIHGQIREYLEIQILDIQILGFHPNQVSNVGITVFFFFYVTACFEVFGWMWADNIALYM